MIWFFDGLILTLQARLTHDFLFKIPCSTFRQFAGVAWQVPLSAGVLQQGTTEEKGENARMVNHRNNRRKLCSKKSCCGCSAQEISCKSAMFAWSPGIYEKNFNNFSVVSVGSCLCLDTMLISVSLYKWVVR